MALSDVDRNLLQRCLARRPGAWEEFVDRFLGLILHVVDHTAQSRSLALSPQDREDLAADTLARLVDQDFAVLRRFRGESSLATYLTVVARRVVVRGLMKRRPASAEQDADVLPDDVEFERRVDDRDEVQRLLQSLTGQEARIVELYHLQGKTYQEISEELGVSINSIGPALSHAREKMRAMRADSTAF